MIEIGALAVSLSACSLFQTPTPTAAPPTAPIVTTSSGADQIALACTMFRPIVGQAGMLGVTPADIQKALADPVNPIGAARAMMGDTLSTRAKIEAYKAVRDWLRCPDALAAK